MPNSQSLTAAHNGRANVLLCPCSVSEGFDANAPPNPVPPYHDFQALWDTGATNSVITQRVVDACGLKPFTMTLVHGVHGQGMSEVYLANIRLPNGVQFAQFRVTKGTMANADVLIGMDIITLGDFAVTNQGGLTVFTFCVPSHRRLDFVQEHNAAAQAAQMNRPGFRSYRPPNAPRPRHHK